MAEGHRELRCTAIVNRPGRAYDAPNPCSRIDYGVIELNEQAFARLKGPKSLEIVPAASHLFPEPGALEAVIGHAARWFTGHLAAKAKVQG